jgi:hypothetical protein
LKYLILVRGAAWDAALAAEMIEAGVHVAAEGLTGPELAQGTVTTPPVTGFYLIDCPSTAEATRWAADGAEIRPVLEPGGHEF